jgi:hypothetical protein
MTAPKLDAVTSEEIPTDEEVSRDFATSTEPEPPIDPDLDEADDEDDDKEDLPPEDGGEA